jgi:hypothetical protein
MFNGTTSEIPEGWHICDGSESTPNLIGKFIKADTSSETSDKDVIVTKDETDSETISSYSLIYMMKIK